MALNDIREYSRAERITAVILLTAIILFALKLVYYDTNELGNVIKIGLGVVLGVFFLALAFLKQLRTELFDRWLKFMVYMPLLIIILIIIGVVIYFFQAMFATNGTDLGGGE